MSVFTPSVKLIYGLSAIVYLAKYRDADPIQTRTISAEQNVPQAYLEQLFIDLKKAGIIKSFRGAKGGYQLVPSPESLTVYAIFEALEGPMDWTSPGGECRGLDFFWTQCQEKVQAVFDVSVASLIYDQQRLEKVLTYSI